MSGTVLVLNSGSSSIRYQVVSPHDGTRLVAGLVERIGETGTRVRHDVGARIVERDLSGTDHRNALQSVMELCAEVGTYLATAGLVAIGHRVVMGGNTYTQPVLIDDRVVAEVERLVPLAPLHNPANLVGIAVARDLFSHLPHVAVFDTAFFTSLPRVSATYALDPEVAAQHGIRRYGAHGTSHRYVSQKAADVLGRPLGDIRQIVLHLGNGASASAVDGGLPVDTSMGFTPLEGLVMGTRSGDLDPSVVTHLIRSGTMTVDEVDDLLNRRSGLKGLSGHNDMREVHRLIAEGDPAAVLAHGIYVHRIRKYIGAYTAVMGGIDAVTFTAGVGENDPITRAAAIGGLDFLGLAVDPALNVRRSREARIISPPDTKAAVLVVPTDEELAIARDAITVTDANHPHLHLAAPPSGRTGTRSQAATDGVETPRP